MATKADRSAEAVGFLLVSQIGQGTPDEPLLGRSVVVTRTREQASSLVARLAGLGATVVELPVIAIEEAADGGAALVEAADRLVAGAYGWVVLTSPNAASRLLVALGGRTVPPEMQWAAVGSGTARALTEGGFAPDLVPTTSVSEALAEAFPAAGAAGAAGLADAGAEGLADAGAAGLAGAGLDGLAGAGLDGLADADLHGRAGGKPVLFPRAETVRGVLASGLRAKGWDVDEVVAYRTVAGKPEPSAVDAATRAEAVAFTSSSTVDRTIDLLGRDAVPTLIATIGPVTSASVRAAGLEVVVEAAEHTIDALVTALIKVLGATPDRAAGR